MLEQDVARHLCEQALSTSRADACEVLLGGGADALTRFANNEIHQNMASEAYELSVRSLIGRRTGRATTTRLDAEGIRRVVEESERVTRLCPERDDLLRLPQPQAYRDVPGAFDAPTADASPETRAEAVRAIVAAAEARDLVAAGFVSTVVGCVGDYGDKGTIAVANSNGLFACHQATALRISATLQGADSTGWVDVQSHRGADLDAAALGRLAADKAVAAAAPRELPPGEYTVVLEAAAVADLLAFTTLEWSATVVDEGRSFLSGRTGSRIFGPNIRLWDDPYHPLHQGTPFDEEGMPTAPVLLVEDGVQRGLVYDRVAAARHGVPPTGHALPVPSTEGAAAQHLVLEGGASSLAEMIQGTERGILVTRFWYTRPVDPRQLLITGMTRDGTFLIEGGEVRHGIKNLRFNHSLIDLLQRVRALGRAVYASPAVVPPLLADGFRFTSTTTF